MDVVRLLRHDLGGLGLENVAGSCVRRASINTVMCERYVWHYSL